MLDPRKAKVSDLQGHRFHWKEDQEDKRPEDHNPFGGWQADGDRMDYVAWGRAQIRGVIKSGMVALAHPDSNRLHIERPLKAKHGQMLRLTCCLTDEAVRLTNRGIKVRVELSGQGAAEVLADDEELKPGDPRVLEIAQPLTGLENKLILEIDNCGREFWTTTFADARVD